MCLPMVLATCSTYCRSALPSSSGGVPTAMNCSAPCATEACTSVVKRSRPAATLRATPLDAFFSVALPLARPGFITAAILSFAHTVGEFGVVLMIGGNLPGITRVASVQIYDHVEALEYLQAHRLSAVMLGFSFVVLLALYAWRPQPRKGG